MHVHAHPGEELPRTHRGSAYGSNRFASRCSEDSPGRRNCDGVGNVVGDATGRGVESEGVRAVEVAARRGARVSASVSPDEAASGPRRPADLVRDCHLSESNREFFEQSAKAHNMSGRAIMRTLSVARTIADMEESHEVLMTHLCEALSFRVREGVGV